MSLRQLESLDLLEKIRLERIWQWLERRDRLVAAVILAVVIAGAFREVVFFGRTLLPSYTTGVMGHSPPYNYTGPLPSDSYRLDPSASAWLTEPLTRKGADELKELKPPLWNPNAGRGVPLAANMQSAVFDVLKIPAGLIHADVMWDVYLLGRFFLGAFATYLFCRCRGFGLQAGLVTSIGFVLSGHFMLYSNTHWLDVYFSLPVLLWACEAILAKITPLRVTGLAVATAFNFYAGMPEPTFLVFLLVGTYALFRLGQKRIEDGAWSETTYRVLALGGGLATGLALAAPVLLPFVEYQSLAFAPGHDFGPGFLHDTSRWAISLFVPYFQGFPLNSARVDAFSGARNWVGILLPFLAFLGLLQVKVRKEVAFFATFAVLGIAKTYGVIGVNDLGRLPLAKLIIYPQFLAPLIAFAISYIAGVGVDRIRNGQGLRQSIVAAFGLTVLSFGLLLVMAQMSGWNLPPGARLWMEFSGVALTIAVLGLWVTSRMDRRLRAWGMVVMVAAEFILLAPRGAYHQRYQSLTQPPYVDYLQQQTSVAEGRGRIFGYSGLLFPNDASAYNLDDIRVVDALYEKRFLTFIRQFISANALEDFTADPNASSESFVDISENKWFNLMGVRYVITDPKGIPNPLMAKLLALGVANVADRTYTVDGEKRTVLFAHAPTDLPFDLTVNPDQSVLRFAPIMDPEVWTSGVTDGVTFQITLEEPGAATVTLYEKSYDVKNPDDLHWHNVALDLSPYMGKTIKLHFKTLPNSNTNGDWAAWASLRLTSLADDVGDAQFIPVYSDKDVSIFQNRDALPRAFAVQGVEQLASGDVVVARMKLPDWSSAKTALIEKKLPDALQAQLSTVSGALATIKLESYDDQRVAIKASMPHTGMVVLTDTYYPGWKAYVDGKETKIYQTDYLFRGVVVPQGDHTIVFKYSPSSFKHGVLLAFLALLALGGWWGYEAYRTRRRRTADAGVV